MQLESYSWACGSAGYSGKNTIPEHVANIAHIIWMTSWNNMSGQQWLLINDKKEPDVR